MTFNDNVQLDTSQATASVAVSSGGRGNGGGGKLPGRHSGGWRDRRPDPPHPRPSSSAVTWSSTAAAHRNPGTGSPHAARAAPWTPPSGGPPAGLAVRWGVRPVQDGGRRKQERRVSRHRHGQQRCRRTGARLSRSTAVSSGAANTVLYPGRPSRRAAPRRTRSGRSTARSTSRSTSTPASSRARAAVRRERRRPRQGVRRGPRVRPPRAGHARAARAAAQRTRRAPSPVRCGWS